MGISCQRNWHWAATNHVSGRGLVETIKELSPAVGWCAGSRCALIRQLANLAFSACILRTTTKKVQDLQPVCGGVI